MARFVCDFHAFRTYPYSVHSAFVILVDSAGPTLVCKASFDARLDNADDDPDLEPMAFYLLAKD